MCDLAHERQFQCLVAHDAETGLSVAKAHLPQGILLDIHLPDHNGLTVLDRLKREPSTRHIPVHVVTVDDDVRQALAMGAVAVTRKPTGKDELLAVFGELESRLDRVGRLLIVQEDQSERGCPRARLLGGKDVETVGVATVREALERLRSSVFDCIVTDLRLPDASGVDLLEQLAKDDAHTFPPVIDTTARALDGDEGTIGFACCRAPSS